MAAVSVVLRTCGLIVFIYLCLPESAAGRPSPEIDSFTAIDVSKAESWQNGGVKRFVVQLRGSGFLGSSRWALTATPGARDSVCGEKIIGSEVHEIEATPQKCVLEISVPLTSADVFLCLYSSERWTHLGSSLTLNAELDADDQNLQGVDYLDIRTTSQKSDDDEDATTEFDAPRYVESTPEASQTPFVFLFPTDVEDVVENVISKTELAPKQTGAPAPETREASFVFGFPTEDDAPLRDPSNTSAENLETNVPRISVVEVPADENDALTVELSRTTEGGHLPDPEGEQAPTSPADSVGNDIPDDSSTRVEDTSRLSDRKEILLDISNDIDETGNGERPKGEIEYFNYDFDDDFDKNLGDVDKKRVPTMLPRKDWIDLSHDIDVNFDENGKLITYTEESVPAKAERLRDEVMISTEVPMSREKKGEKENTWGGFRDALEKGVPNHWIDLSHDIDVNYPSADSGVILDVEGIDVEKNMFDSGKSNPEVLDDDNIEANTETSEWFSMYKEGAREVVPDSELNRRKREVAQRLESGPADAPLRLLSLRVEVADKDLETKPHGIPELLAETDTTIRVFGEGITTETVVAFTHQVGSYGGPCLFPATGSYEMVKDSVEASGRSARIAIRLPSGVGGNHTFYACAKRVPESASADSVPFVHQGSEAWQCLNTYDPFLPLWVTMLIIGVCLTFSALFSGLNLGLMSLDRTELKILCNTGTEKEREYARVIQPVRDHGNFLLCSILLGNVAVNSTFTILLDSLTSGIFAVIFSTISIVLLGEITPQAICSRHGLAVGAKTIHVTKLVMAVTFPLAYPVSKLLDFLLGEEIGNVYNRERLKELVKVTNDINDLDKDEVNIISGALELRKKTVMEVMTKIEDVFMLDYDVLLDFETVSEIMKSGFSRIPVFEGSRSNIVTMLYIKDLAFVDPDDNTPLRTLCQFYQNPCNFVFEDVTLDVIFKQFKEGHKGHMAFVQRVNNEGEGDPFYETIGLVTLEDVIEELIQAEIMDETDVFTDNRSKRRRNRPPNKLQDFGVFAERRENQRIRISPQLTLATFQYLSTSVDAFKPDMVSETILRRMLKQEIIHHIKFRSKERQKSDPTTLIYEQGKAVDYFVLILEGRVEVTVGRECLVFESGPFTYFGTQALTQNVGIAESPVVAPSAMGSLQSINMDAMLRYSFIPDYSVRAITEVFYVSIKRSLYLAAKRATLMERCSRSGGGKGGLEDAADQFDDEVEKLLHSLEEEGSPTNMTRSPSHILNSHPVSPTAALNGSVTASRQSSRHPSRHASPARQSPARAAPLAPLAIPEGESNGTHEASSLLPS